MSACAAEKSEVFPRRKTVSVNGVTIPHQLIAQEAQNHRAATPAQAFAAAGRALAIRELLLQEARRLGVTLAPEQDAEGRRETDEDALIRALIARATSTRPRIFSSLQTQRTRLTRKSLRGN
jgi:peptidyl-prolyl cis-trans isomerase C